MNFPIADNVIRIDITGKEIGDTVSSPISANDIIVNKNAYRQQLVIDGVNGDTTLYTNNYYTSGSGTSAQVIFLTGLPELNGTQLTALLLSGNEFTLIGGVQPTPTPSEPPYVEDGDWTYTLYDDGAFEAWYYKIGDEMTITEASGNLFRSEAKELELPVAITNKGEFYLSTALVQVSHLNYACVGVYSGTFEKGIKYEGLSGASRVHNKNYRTSVYVMGRVIS